MGRVVIEEDRLLEAERVIANISQLTLPGSARSRVTQALKIIRQTIEEAEPEEEEPILPV